ncbi:hypothetical protein EG327_003145 [Venturia inaequalis]|uniref:Uncharacterized protein n=2 Tax=Venturia inaequalis TaxID=5025 RepID=A0A8H3VF98_VENIN|nr:hypothetical protein EG327_003145 [Venturia inaequalis]
MCIITLVTYKKCSHTRNVTDYCGRRNYCGPWVVDAEDEKDEYCMRWWCAKSRKAKERVNELEGMLEEQRRQIERQNEEIRRLKERGEYDGGGYEPDPTCYCPAFPGPHGLHSLDHGVPRVNIPDLGPVPDRCCCVIQEPHLCCCVLQEPHRLLDHRHPWKRPAPPPGRPTQFEFQYGLGDTANRFQGIRSRTAADIATRELSVKARLGEASREFKSIKRLLDKLRREMDRSRQENEEGRRADEWTYQNKAKQDTTVPKAETANKETQELEFQKILDDFKKSGEADKTAWKYQKKARQDTTMPKAGIANKQKTATAQDTNSDRQERIYRELFAMGLTKEEIDKLGEDDEKNFDPEVMQKRIEEYVREMRRDGLSQAEIDRILKGDDDLSDW